jgi:hypothetical protein
MQNPPSLTVLLVVILISRSIVQFCCAHIHLSICSTFFNAISLHPFQHELTFFTTS